MPKRKLPDLNKRLSGIRDGVSMNAIHVGNALLQWRCQQEQRALLKEMGRPEFALEIEGMKRVSPHN